MFDESQRTGQGPRAERTPDTSLCPSGPPCLWPGRLPGRALPSCAGLGIRVRGLCSRVQRCSCKSFYSLLSLETPDFLRALTGFLLPQQKEPPSPCAGRVQPVSLAAPPASTPGPRRPPPCRPSPLLPLTPRERSLVTLKKGYAFLNLQRNREKSQDYQANNILIQKCIKMAF